MIKVPVGISDFAKLRDEQFDFIDKSLFIKDVIDGSEVLLFTRPRRFGKTLNMSMLYYYFAKSDRQTGELFHDLKIWQTGEHYKAQQGKYPVIFLTFKDVKEFSYESAYQNISEIIRKLYSSYESIRSSLLPNEEKIYQNILNNEAREIDIENSIENLTVYLHRHYEVKPILLIDEYDTPIHAAHNYQYYDEMINLMRGLLGSALKDNSHLQKGVLTGILRTSKESLFSGLNNLDVYSLLHEKYAEYFGFTHEEVMELLKKAELTDLSEEVRRWYNGYHVGKFQLYNPWSIINFIKRDGSFSAYWVNTGDEKQIEEIIWQYDSILEEEIENLLASKPINQIVNENIIFSDLDDEDVIWGFLHSAGYLTIHNMQMDSDGVTTADYLIPNHEVMALFKVLVRRWFRRAKIKVYQNTINALLRGQVDTFKKGLSTYILQTLSYFDTKKKEPEQFFHAFILGFLASVTNEYQVLSNRESGHGRYDIALLPHDKKRLAVIFELKALATTEDDEALQKAAQLALKQINELAYVTEFSAAGADNVLKVGIAFAGKRVAVEAI